MAATTGDCNDVGVEFQRNDEANIIARRFDIHVCLEFNDVRGPRIHEPKIVA
jgi:hypothetical protein